MKLFTCTDHDAHWVGGSSVVVAEDEAEATQLLDAKLAEHGLKPRAEVPYALTERDISKPVAFVLDDGDY